MVDMQEDLAAQKERAQRLARRAALRDARQGLQELPAEEWFEIPGRWVGLSRLQGA